jgi:MFS family permease
MSSRSKMTPLEMRASVGLSGIFGLRMLGMFVILPVFAIYATHLPGGSDLALVGIALGAYGLTQALLQIPFGWLSDRYGRKPIIYAGLVVFALGSFIAAAAPNIYIVIVGRVVQGAGAVSAAVIALTADLTRDEHRTKAMAMIGSTIGFAFALSLVAGPWLDERIGVPGIFALTGVLALAAIGVTWRVVPDVVGRHAERALDLRELGRVVRNGQLLRLDYGIFTLQAVLMSMFMSVPFALKGQGLAVDSHWEVYLPVMLLSFVLMVPAIIYAEKKNGHKPVFVGAVALLALDQLAMPWLLGSVERIFLLLLVYFTAFNILEASLPSLISRIAPASAKGTAVGVYSSSQFLGSFIGAAVGGLLYQHWGVDATVTFNLVLIAGWLLFASGMIVPSAVETKIYTIPEMGTGQAHGLSEQLQSLPGVREVLVIASERLAYVKVDRKGFDEQTVLELIAGRT